MASNRRTGRYNGGHRQTTQVTDALDVLAEFEQYRDEIFPKLRAMLKKGATAEELYKFAQSYAAARAITIGVGSRDEKAALSAIKEILDRGVGKPAESVTLTTKYENLSDEALDKLLEQQEAQVGQMGDKDKDSLPH